MMDFHDVAENSTLALALLLGVGFAAAKVSQRFRLPSVTGYIVAGLLLGPSCLGIVTTEAIGARLEHFTQIALMLLAFGIGEHLEWKRLRHTAKSLLCISAGETAASFLVVAGGSFALLWTFGVGAEAWSARNLLVLALFLGAVSIATAPASTLHVIREIRAAGPLTTTLMQVVALNNGLAIMAFGLVVALAGQVSGGSNLPWFAAFAESTGALLLSLLLGIAVGLFIDLLIHRLSHRSEMLTTGLALLIACGETARLLGLSPLLAGMAAGCAIVNRDHRDVRLFRVLNAFEPPIYVLFFTLAGAHLDLSTLVVAGWLGIAYFLLRALGKIGGARLGCRIAGAAPAVCAHLGSALLSQAGVAIGLILLLDGEPALKAFSDILTPVVLAGVLLAEIIGPVAARRAVEKAGETAEAMTPEGKDGPEGSGADEGDEGAALVPWSWERLVPPAEQHGVVLFGASRARTVGGLARIATLLAHHHGGRPLAVRVVPPDCATEACAPGHELFCREEDEVRSLGYELSTALIRSDNVPEALVQTARQAEARAIVLGHPLAGSLAEMQKIVEVVAKDADCPVVVLRYAGAMHTERILVPIVSMRELAIVREVLAALAGVGRHRMTILRLMPSYVDEEDVEMAEHALVDWAIESGFYVYGRAVATEARQETILAEAENHDLLVMAANQAQGLQRLFFGSLAADVAERCPRPLLMVYRPGSAA